MSNIQTSAKFKTYDQERIPLFPLTFEGLIDKDQLVRLVSTLVDSMDINEMVMAYKGGGTTAHHPRMLLKYYCMLIV